MSIKRTLIPFIIASLIFPLAPGDTVRADSREAVIRKWAAYFSHSTLTEEERIEELRWFVEVTEPFRGRTIRSVAEDIETHFWERDVLTVAFEELTGIHVEHDIIGEGSLVQRLVEQETSGRRIYDIYVNDADLVGTHLRTGGVVNLTEYMAGEGAAITSPYLDLDDWMNLEFGTDYDGNLLQLPDRAIASNLCCTLESLCEPNIDHGMSRGLRSKAQVTTL